MPALPIVAVGLGLALLIGVALGLLGGGGSILTVPILVYVFGQEPHAAIATSLVVVGATSLVALVAHARAGRVRWKTGLLFGAASMVGAYAAGRVAYLVPGVALLVGFGGLMMLTAWAMLQGKQARVPRGSKGPRAVLLILAEGLVVGGVTGLVGAGGGFLVVPALVVLGGLPMPAAIATSLLVIVLKSGAALAGHLGGAAAIDLGLAGLVTGAAVIGSFAGAALSARIAPARLRRIFAWFVVVMAVFLLAQEIPRALGHAVSLARDWPWIGALVLAAVLAAWIVEHTLARRMQASEQKAMP